MDFCLLEIHDGEFESLRPDHFSQFDIRSGRLPSQLLGSFFDRAADPDSSSTSRSSAIAAWIRPESRGGDQDFFKSANLVSAQFFSRGFSCWITSVVKSVVSVVNRSFAVSQ